MLTNKAKYGLKAVVHLSRLDPGGSASIAEIAEAEDLPKKFLEAILADLRNAGFVKSRKGRGGGYALARAAAQIQIGDVIRALDGPLAPIPCASRTAYVPCDDCTDLLTCSVRLLMTEVRDAMADILDHTTLAQMSARAKVTRAV
ncbi:MAG TPA: Rrf2 family transcriptional regulator [Caulobacteraceae bacterium]|jgi:Rrf2 family protein|nr:Rrf2 family transcriptional regulator [Caulobacteraceae bacterium]